MAGPLGQQRVQGIQYLVQVLICKHWASLMVHRSTSVWTRLKCPELTRSELGTHAQAYWSDPGFWEKMQVLGLSTQAPQSDPWFAYLALTVQRLVKSKEVLQETCWNSSLFVLWWRIQPERGKRRTKTKSQKHQIRKTMTSYVLTPKYSPAALRLHVINSKTHIISQFIIASLKLGCILQ